MFDKCYHCGQPGHTRRQCPQRARVPAVAPASPAPVRWKNLGSGPRHDYPEDHWLLYRCDFCGAGPYQPCVNIGTGKDRPAHFTRLDAVKAGTGGALASTPAS